MYESETQEVIMQRMLDRVPTKFDKREGSIIHDALAPASVELQNFNISLDGALNEAFIDTASREKLIRHCAMRGITPKPASYAIVKGQFTPASLEVPIGTRFSHEDFNYIVTEKISDGLYYLQCETIGSNANGVTGQLIPIDYVAGLKTAEIIEVSILGEDEEDTESLRARGIGSYRSEAFGGNQLDYETTLLSMPGVGGVKIYSGAQWNGGGTVLIVVKDSDNGVPTDDLIDQIQTNVDPMTNSGEGVGLAPVGHFVTIAPANNTVVNIETTLTYGQTATWASVKEKVQAAVDKYLGTLNAGWKHGSDPIIVRKSYIENYILTVDGIIDIQNTMINGSSDNLAVDKDSLVSRGTINGE